MSARLGNLASGITKKGLSVMDARFRVVSEVDQSPPRLLYYSITNFGRCKVWSILLSFRMAITFPSVHKITGVSDAVNDVMCFVAGGFLCFLFSETCVFDRTCVVGISGPPSFAEYFSCLVWVSAYELPRGNCYRVLSDPTIALCRYVCRFRDGFLFLIFSLRSRAFILIT